MRQLIVSAQGRADLAKITRDIVKNNGRLVAERVVAQNAQIIDEYDILPGYWNQARTIGFRPVFLAMAPYVAFYRVTDEHLEIVRIVHGHRRITRRLVLEGGDEN